MRAENKIRRENWCRPLWVVKRIGHLEKWNWRWDRDRCANGDRSHIRYHLRCALWPMQWLSLCRVENSIVQIDAKGFCSIFFIDSVEYEAKRKMEIILLNILVAQASNFIDVVGGRPNMAIHCIVAKRRKRASHSRCVAHGTECGPFSFSNWFLNLFHFTCHVPHSARLSTRTRIRSNTCISFYWIYDFIDWFEHRKNEYGNWYERMVVTFSSCAGDNGAMHDFPITRSDMKWIATKISIIEWKCIERSIENDELADS